MSRKTVFDIRTVEFSAIVNVHVQGEAHNQLDNESVTCTACQVTEKRTGQNSKWFISFSDGFKPTFASDNLSIDDMMRVAKLELRLQVVQELFKNCDPNVELTVF